MSETKKKTISTKILIFVVVLVVIAAAVWAIMTYAFPKQEEAAVPTEPAATETMTTDVTEVPPADVGSLLVWLA